jgi:hypothetical protein
MLDKMFGVDCFQATHNSSDGDFNAMNKEMYQVWMLDNACKYKLIQEEIFSKQNRTAANGDLAKKAV